MQGAFISALTYTPPRVFGRQLRPFSPFHGVLLEAAESPYILGGVPDLNDAILAVWICSHSFTDGYLGAMDFAKIKRWGRSCRKKKTFTTDKAMSDIAEHIKTSQQHPEHWSKKRSKDARCPIWWLLATFAQADLHMTKSEAWDCSVMELFCYVSSKNEMDGDETLVSDNELKGMKKP